MTQELLDGLTRFKQSTFPARADRYRRLVAEGQEPHTLFIGCADSRVVPGLLTDSDPGDLFVVRNVGNVVPPPEPEAGHWGITSGVDFAVDILGVENIVVCGHSHCGAVGALYDPPAEASENLGRWLELAAPARLDGDVTEDLLRRTERRSVTLQIDRLLTYPNVRRAVEAGELTLHGWHYVIEDGTVHVLDRESGAFLPHG